jgi:small-conductance mechanosensitive channel
MTDRDDLQRRENVSEVLDDLIFHLNTTRSTFNFLIVSSFILAPLALIVAAVFIGYPRFLFFLLQRIPELGAIIIIFLAISVILASVWLAIGIKERRFFCAWNKRFNRFMSLKDKIDKELSDDKEPTDNKRQED